MNKRLQIPLTPDIVGVSVGCVVNETFNAICQTVVGSSKVNRKLASEPELICETEAISGQVLPPVAADIPSSRQ